MSIHWPILRALAAEPRRIAAVDDRGRYTAAQVLGGALHLASSIESKCASWTVGVMLPTGAAFPMAALAGWMVGKTVVPLNYLLKPEELQYVIDNSEADTIVTAGPLLEHMKFTPRVKSLVRVDEVEFRCVPEVRWPARAAEEDLALLLYTSGTSGRPKGVMLTHGNLRANAEQVRSWVHFTRSDRMLGVLPQFHTFGLTVLTLLPLAASVGVTYSARFMPPRVMKLIREHRPTILVAIPSMYGALLSVKDGGPEDFASVRLAVSGGEPLPDAVAARFKERFGVTLAEGYGLTETSPVTNMCRPEEYKPHSVGPPLPRITERIVDVNTARVLPPGQDGEIQIAGPNVMRGYFKLPEESAAAFTPDGFFRTGDIGRLDDDGHLFITGRLKEMMIVGGENVFPREIEEVLNRHPGVAASGVIGVNDPVRGELPLAFVEMREVADPANPGAHAPAPFDERELLAWCRQHLAGYKVPSEIRRLDALPKNATGKVMRRELRGLARPTQAPAAQGRP